MDPFKNCYEANLVHKVIRMLRMSKRNEQCGLLKEIAPIIVYASEDDVRSLLLFINITTDVELLIKLFLLLSIYLTNNGLYSETIITCDELYYKLHDILMKGLLYKYMDVLYLLTAMTHCDESGGNSRKLQVAHYAKNIIRVSGCLGALTQFFLHSTLNKDTWQALCHCLAMCCRDSQMNQDYNSYLIPKCVEMCNRGDIPVLSLILSLVNGNQTNTNKFMKCKGLGIFTRNNLERESFLEILNALVQSSQEVVSELIDSYVPSVLTQLFKIHRGQTRIGQWCKVILHNIEINTGYNHKHYPIEVENNSYIESSVNTTILYENVMKEIKDWKHSKNYSVGTFHSYAPGTSVSCTTPVQINRASSLTTQYKNNRVENFSWNFVHNDKDRDEKQNKPIFRLNNDKKKSSKRLQTNIDHSLNSAGKATFNKHSKLQTIIESQTTSNTNHSSIDSKNGISLMHLLDMHRLDETIKVEEPSIRSRQNYTNADKACQVDSQSFFEQSCPFTKKFSPPIKSTPKRASRRDTLHFTKNVSNIPRNCKNVTESSNEQKVKNCKLSISFKRPKNISHHIHAEGTSKDTSLSTKLYKTINETCGTLYSKVKNIFSQSKNPGDSYLSTRNLKYSFTKYMRKRDAVLKYSDELQEKSGRHQMLVVHSCHTCNDTQLLQNKLKCNPEFKDTIDKLKMGLQQYGCDFEKMSNTLWPNEPYMTPKVLYHFYKKLILK